MRTYWPLLLALTRSAHGQYNSTVLGAQATPSPPSSSAEAAEETFQAQGGGYCQGSTCKTTSTIYEYGKPSTSTIKVTVTSPQTCPKPVTKTQTVTSSQGYGGGYPVTVTVTSTKEVTKSAGNNPSPPKTITVTSTKEVTKSDGYNTPPKTITVTTTKSGYTTVTSPGYCANPPPITTTMVCLPLDYT